ncbi:hypothetical protein SPBR_09100 [Sporothrix brasiliensis 5110]|uniref:Uncharacterized protein n=1 Tax=Sporothrix brasiliensis 5110 TaxID=1398154 RepID=A0A0C2EWW4_9PEZI|nr:uncharacterized protein SPBR_09100 [Sporothrix brasiliensis 5110]KIH91064.1 hypothetical protein SPBR_09100 [Sporothrix brasiliensis 5110]
MVGGSFHEIIGAVIMSFKQLWRSGLVWSIGNNATSIGTLTRCYMRVSNNINVIGREHCDHVLLYKVMGSLT